jgi:DNA-binding MarR family transcriptional regulator
MPRQLTNDDYQRLLQFRTSLRRFLHWSEQQARVQDLTAAQHQLLLAIKGHPDPRGPTIGDAAGYLLLRHHSAVGLVDRAEANGLVTRTPDPDHRGTVRLTLTDDGDRRLQALSELHIEELARLARAMQSLVTDLQDHGSASRPHSGAAT